MQTLAIGGAQYNPATGGQHTFWIKREFSDDRFLDITEPVFALAFEVLADRAAQLLLYHMVRIEKGKLKSSGKLPPNGGFPGTGEAYE